MKPRPRAARTASIVLAIAVLAYWATQQAALATAEPPLTYGWLLAMIALFYTSLLILRWVAVDAPSWVRIIQNIAAFVLAFVLAILTAGVAWLIAAGYLFVIAGTTAFERIDRGARSRANA